MKQYPLITTILMMSLMGAGPAHASWFSKKNINHITNVVSKFDVTGITKGISALSGEMDSIGSEVFGLKDINSEIKNISNDTKNAIEKILRADGEHHKIMQEAQEEAARRAKKRIEMMERRAKKLAKVNLERVLKGEKLVNSKFQNQVLQAGNNQKVYEKALREGLEQQYYETNDQKKVIAAASELGVSLSREEQSVLAERERQFRQQATLWGQVKGNQDLQEKRLGKIKELDEMIEGLEDNSELETMHLIAAQNQLALKQKEELIALQNQALAATEFNRTIEANKRSEWTIREQKRKKRVREKWSNSSTPKNIKSFGDLLKLGIDSK